MSKYGSLKNQVIQHMKQMEKFDESKHNAKMLQKELCSKTDTLWNPSKVPGIYSFKTFNTYKIHSMHFIEWLKMTYPNIKKIENINQSHIDKYMEHKIAEKKSAYTLKTSKSALNKVFSIECSLDLPRRSYKKVVRSRNAVAHDNRINLKNYNDIIEFATACGCRRKGLEKVKAGDVKDLGGKVVVFLKEKGGRERYATVLRAKANWISNFVINKAVDELLFKNVSSLLDIHSFRRKYAELRYLELVEKLGEKITLKTRDGRLFDRDVLKIVTEDMGHSRISVLTSHYLNNTIFRH